MTATDAALREARARYDRLRHSLRPDPAALAAARREVARLEAEAEAAR